MKKVLFFTEKLDLLEDFKGRLLSDNIEATVMSHKDIDLFVDGENTSIKIHNTGEDLTNFSAIVCLLTPEHRLIDIFSSIGCYARKKSIKMIDDTFTNTSGKLYEMWRLWENDIPVPKTAYGSIDFLIKKLEEFGGTAVLKSTHSAKGKDNYLVRSAEEIKEILRDRDTSNYILQNFIPNDGDYRIITMNFEPKFGIYRSSGGKDHRNNTSLGGHADIIEITPKLAEIARVTSAAMDIKFAGVDIITDKETGKNYVLEVNRTPQFASGSFIDKKYKALRDFLQSI